MEKKKPVKNPLVSESLTTLPTDGMSVTVVLSNSLINLLSDQLYHSPVKAVEELVVNAFDAEAKHCCVFVPFPSDEDKRFAVVFDDGYGMSYQGLQDLWQIGHSDKREEEIEKRLQRKQIGKFGIGKLAARTIANRLTYISKRDASILAISVDFNKFASGSVDSIKEIKEDVHKIDDLDAFLATTSLGAILNEAINDGARDSLIAAMALKSDASLADILKKLPSWTIAVLESLTEKSLSIKHGTLGWVLSTAMPLISEFNLFLNGEVVVSSKEDHESIVSFNIADLPNKRLRELEEKIGIKWKKDGEVLKTGIFPTGVSGEVLVLKQTITGQKSDDLQRSHGFFVKVRGRLVNYADPLFGLSWSN